MPYKVDVTEEDDPKLEKKDDIIVKITSTAICGSDLHLYQGNMPLPKGYMIGHEPMGIVEEVGPEVTRVKKVIASLFLLMLRVVIASIVIKALLVNATTRILITIQVVISVTPKSLETTLEDKQSI